jgi:hypothetical protein
LTSNFAFRAPEVADNTAERHSAVWPAFRN